jgi:hypothetical protein
MNWLRCGAALAALFAVLLGSNLGEACPFCSEERGPTLVGEFDKAHLVLLGHFENPRIAPGTDKEESDFIIEKVMKSDAAVKGKTKLVLPKHIQSKSQFLLYGEVYKGQIDPYRGVEITPGSDLVKYLEGAMALKGKSAQERLRYCFDYLISPETEVSLDAYREFAQADYKDYKEMAKKLNPDVIAKWLLDPKTPPYRYGLYASLLGHCGGPEHGKILRAMIEDPEKRKSSGLHGLMAAYTMIEPKTAWEYVSKTMKDAGQPFLVRYAALGTARFLWSERTDLVEKSDLIQGLLPVLKQPDIADFVIEDLRKWKRWETADAVLDLGGKESHDLPIIQKSILRYALSCPEKRAVEYVQAMRKKDAELVKDTEELLKYDSDSGK